MHITIKNHAARLATAVAAVIVFVLLFVWVGKAYLAGVIAEKPDLKNYQTAMRLDPGEAQYALSAGRAYQYSIQNANPEMAIKDLTRSIQLNAYDAQAWLDLGTALEFQGNNDEAEECMRRADTLAPRIPSFQWAIGNFFLLHNHVQESFRHLKMVLAGNAAGGDTGYEEEIYNTAWKASGNGRAILASLIPDSPGPEIGYLDYLLSTHRLSETGAVWDRLASSRDKFPAPDAAFYMDVLIGAHQAVQAWKVWTTLREKGLIPPTYLPTAQNRVENGNFENALLGFGFGWRVAGVSGVYVDLDDSAYHSAAKSLLIQFPGNQNLEYHNVYQFVPVLPSHRYHLTAFMKTDNITTDSGPRIEVKDAYTPALLDKYSDQLTGTTPTWTPLSIDFETGPKTDLVVVDIARPASQEFANQIAGKVWV
ncbi:MAG: tetratricopeptide repeat protein, partial [Terriglobia bacterium]